MAKLLLSWPVLIVIFAAVFVINFKYELGTFISKLQEAQLPGGLILRQKQVDTSGMTMEQVDSLISQRDVGWRQTLDNIFQQQHAEWDATNKRLFDIGIYWRFEFANHYLVKNSKALLVWINSNQPISISEFYNHWMSILNDELELTARMNALSKFEFVIFKDNHILITQIGQLFVSVYLQQLNTNATPN